MARFDAEDLTVFWRPEIPVITSNKQREDMIAFPVAVERVFRPALSANPTIPLPDETAQNLGISVKLVSVLANPPAEILVGVRLDDQNQIHVTPLAMSGWGSKDLSRMRAVVDLGTSALTRRIGHTIRSGPSSEFRRPERLGSGPRSHRLYL